MRPVWVVDDDRSIRWVFEKALTREGIPFETFSLAQDAIDALKQGAPQVLVSDIRMPGTSGLELLQTVKAQFPALPVIVPSATLNVTVRVALSASAKGVPVYVRLPATSSVRAKLAGAVTVGA